MRHKLRVSRKGGGLALVWGILGGGGGSFPLGTAVVTHTTGMPQLKITSFGVTVVWIVGLMGAVVYCVTELPQGVGLMACALFGHTCSV